jgi:DNA-binding transcriptional ArsR family regulator
MVQSQREHLDAAFVALADSTRRGVLERLGQSDASITELAERFHMTLTGIKKHVSVLEDVGLVTTEKVGRVRTCRIGTTRLEDLAGWVERYQQMWDARFAALDDVVEELQRREKRDEHRNEQRADGGAQPGDGGADV